MSWIARAMTLRRSSSRRFAAMTAQPIKSSSVIASETIERMESVLSSRSIG
ncbi:hypothetical protein [Sorangium sp. So ce854]|uniref:hypothetical protein n=1 Tax=Sorangium sp. So ce854 TaxID=3133322 RepID=UPI003F5D5B2B